MGHAFIRCHRPWETMASFAVPDSPTPIDCCIFQRRRHPLHPHGLKPTRSPNPNRPERVESDPGRLGGQGWPGPAVPWPQKIQEKIFLFARRRSSRRIPSISSIPPWPSRSPCSYSTSGAGRERADWLLVPGHGKSLDAIFFDSPFF